MRVADADLLDEFLEEQTVYSSDFQVLILRVVYHQSGNVEWVCQQTGVPISTVYGWLNDWNKAPRLEKNVSQPSRSRGGRRVQCNQSHWQAWREGFESDEQSHWSSRDLLERFEVKWFCPA